MFLFYRRMLLFAASTKIDHVNLQILATKLDRAINGGFIVPYAVVSVVILSYQCSHK